MRDKKSVIKLHVWCQKHCVQIFAPLIDKEGQEVMEFIAFSIPLNSGFAYFFSQDSELINPNSWIPELKALSLHSFCSLQTNESKEFIIESLTRIP